MPENKVQPKFAGGDPKFFQVEEAGGINTKPNRGYIKDNEFYWLENLMPVGDGNFRTLYSNGASVGTAPGGTTIIYAYFFNVVSSGGNTNYVAVFFSDGSAAGVNLGNNVVTSIAGAGTFYPGVSQYGDALPAAAQWAQGGIAIVATSSTNALWTWDGTTLIGPGGAAPSWFDGGNATTMPTGIYGTAVTVYQSRLWVYAGNIAGFSAPGNGADWNPADGSGTFVSNDSFLRRQFTQGVNINGFLYNISDSSINVISNVQTSGSPVLTTFNNQNVDPQVGTPFPNSIQVWQNKIVFVNDQGVFTLSGGSTQKVSDSLDGLFPGAMANQMVPASSAVQTINGIRVYMFVLAVKGPLDSSFRNALAMWDGKNWWIGSQVSSLTAVWTQEIDSELQAWGTDGTHLFQLFVTPSASLIKVWQSKLWHGDSSYITKQALRLWTTIDNQTATSWSVSGTIDYIGENTVILQQSVTVTSPAAGDFMTGVGSIAANIRGNYIGLTMQSTSQDFILVNQTLLYRNESPFGG